MCKSKGFVAVDVDNVDVFEAGEALTGFDLTEEEGKEYVLWLANTAHSMGMAFGLKNAINLLQHPLVVKTIDFAVNEAALEIGEAELYLPLWKGGSTSVTATHVLLDLPGTWHIYNVYATAQKRPPAIWTHSLVTLHLLWHWQCRFCSRCDAEACISCAGTLGMQFTDMEA
jgi:hypothetical protein